MSRARDSDTIPVGSYSEKELELELEAERPWMNAPAVNGRPGLTVERVLVLVLCVCLANENTDPILTMLWP